MKILIAASFLLMVVGISFGQEKQFSIVFLNKNPNAAVLPKEELKKIMEGHLATQERLWKEGKLIASGPFEGGGGMFIMTSNNIAQVKEWISVDPSIIADRWIIEVFPYQPRYGSVCPVGENYEMTYYAVVRFDAIGSKFTANNFPELMREHDQHLKKLVETGNVLTEVIFGDNVGGIMVMKGEVDPAVIHTDPAVKAGLIETTQKKLFIAKGSFCEK